MASFIPSRALTVRLMPVERARILLVNRDLRELSRHRTILRRAGCQVRASSSFAEGTQCLGREPYDLVLLDQGNGGFEGREVLARAMEIDPELRVLVLGRAHDHGCYLEALQSGALDYLEEPLSAADMVALLETFVPRAGPHRIMRDPVKGPRSSKKRKDKTESNSVRAEMNGEHGETRKSFGSTFRPRQPGGNLSYPYSKQN